MITPRYPSLFQVNTDVARMPAAIASDIFFGPWISID
jgi:hypothetical protein